MIETNGTRSPLRLLHFTYLYVLNPISESSRGGGGGGGTTTDPCVTRGEVGPRDPARSHSRTCARFGIYLYVPSCHSRGPGQRRSRSEGRRSECRDGSEGSRHLSGEKATNGSLAAAGVVRRCRSARTLRGRDNSRVQITVIPLARDLARQPCKKRSDATVDIQFSPPFFRSASCAPTVPLPPVLRFLNLARKSGELPSSLFLSRDHSRKIPNCRSRRGNRRNSLLPNSLCSSLLFPSLRLSLKISSRDSFPVRSFSRFTPRSSTVRPGILRFGSRAPLLASQMRQLQTTRSRHRVRPRRSPGTTLDNDGCDRDRATRPQRERSSIPPGDLSRFDSHSPRSPR